MELQWPTMAPLSPGMPCIALHQAYTPAGTSLVYAAAAVGRQLAWLATRVAGPPHGLKAGVQQTLTPWEQGDVTSVLWSDPLEQG